jgi:UDP-N-acetylmuramyl pentapeptide synthase
MADLDFDNLLTAGAIAKTLGASDAKVKKAIKDLGLQPRAKKGVCAYYSKDVLPKVKAAVAK